MKKMRKILLLLMLLILVVGCDNSNNSEKTDAILFQEEYENLNGKESDYGSVYRSLDIEKDNPFVYKEAGDILKMIDDEETFVVYFGFASCPWCRSVIPSLIEVSRDLGIQTIYYVDVKEIRDVLTLDENGSVILEKEGTNDYYRLVEKFDDVLERYVLTDEDGKEVDTGKKRIYAPNIISIVNGEVMGMTDGISQKQTDAYMELTEEIKDESYDKIKCTIECIVDSKEVCYANRKC